MSASTVGFSLTDDYRPRLERLVQRMTPGNRSEFLRRAIEVMERYGRAQDLAALQEYGELLSRAKGTSVDDVGRIQGSSTADYPADVSAWARDLVAGIARPSGSPDEAGAALHPLARLVIEDIAGALSLTEPTK